jgi:hypothetical protein
MATQLPDRNRDAEEVFVEAWRQLDDPSGLADCVSAALEAGRPQLAGRLVGLLEGRVEIPAGSALERAQRAARLLLMATPDQEAVLGEDLEQAWLLARREELRRIRHRVRERSQQVSGLFLDQAGQRQRQPRLSWRKRKR